MELFYATIKWVLKLVWNLIKRLYKNAILLMKSFWEQDPWDRDLVFVSIAAWIARWILITAFTLYMLGELLPPVVPCNCAGVL